MNYLATGHGLSVCSPFVFTLAALPFPFSILFCLQLALKLYSLTAVVFSSRSVRFCLLFRKLIIFEDEAASPLPTFSPLLQLLLCSSQLFCAFFSLPSPANWLLLFILQLVCRPSCSKKLLISKRQHQALLRKPSLSTPLRT